MKFFEALASLAIFVLVLMLAAAMAGCRPPPPKPLPGATCGDVCRRLAELRCPGAGQTAEGATCIEVCESIIDSGLVPFDLACRSTAPSCEAMDRCEERR